jgi:NADH:ubiquinone oxidoreductase subunit 3 (subunit A)
MRGLLAPPIAFVLVLAASAVVFWLMGRLSYRPQTGNEANSKPYACGEEGQPLVRPDYGQVFPFAFFFTILHVVALVTATVPDGSVGTVTMALVYVFGAIVGLFVLYRR